MTDIKINPNTTTPQTGTSGTPQEAKNIYESMFLKQARKDGLCLETQSFENCKDNVRGAIATYQVPEAFYNYTALKAKETELKKQLDANAAVLNEAVCRAIQDEAGTIDNVKERISAHGGNPNEYKDAVYNAKCLNN